MPTQYQTIPAGIGYATILPDMDFETYSEAGYYWDESLACKRFPQGKWRAPNGFPNNKPGLPSIGAARYVEHPSTEIISLAYNLKDGRGQQLWVADMKQPESLCTHIRNGGLIEAWNVGFEFLVWHYVAHLRLGWPALPLNQIRCAMAKAAAYGFPGALDLAVTISGASEQKDAKGKKLIRLLSCPQTPTKKQTLRRLTPESNPQDFAEFYDYNGQDIVTEAAVSAVVPDLTPEELELWQLDQVINTRGVQIDIEGLANCMTILVQAREKYIAELRTITGIPTLTIDQLKQIKEWMAMQGFEVGSLKAEVVDSLLTNVYNKPPDNVRRVLEIRQVMGSASVKKLYAIDRSISNDGRLRGLYAYYGARQTGRFAGRGSQPQNMPAGGPEVVECDSCEKPYYSKLPICRHCGHIAEGKNIDWGIEAAELSLRDIATRELNHVEQHWHDALKAISGSLRALFIAAPGRDLICSDFSAIEAVCLAAEAGEEWRLEVFRTHGKIYEESAARITGIPFQEFLDFKERTKQHHPMRKKIGKPAELGSGYQGWIQAWKNFGADKFLNDKEIKEGILKWRAASPMIVEYWGGQWRKNPDYWEFTPELYGIEGTMIMAILSPGQAYSYRGITYCVLKDVLYCRLLSGRYLTYHKPELHNGFDALGHPIFQITYMGWNSDTKKGPKGWMRRHTYGGSSVENITQAIARCRFTYSLIEIEKAGYPVVLHSHDEMASEVPKDFGSVKEYEQIMGRNPAWCQSWPIFARGGWRGKRYRKD